MADETEKPASQQAGSADTDPQRLVTAAAPAGTAADRPWSAAAATAASSTERPAEPSGDAAAVAPPVAAVPSSSSGLKPLLITLVLLALVGGAGYLTRASWLPMLGLGETPRMAAPAQPAVPLTGQTGAGPSAAGPVPGSATPALPAPPPAAVAPELVAEQARLASEIQSLGGQVATLEKSLATLSAAIDTLTAQQENDKGLVTAITAIDDRVSRLERSAIQTSALESQVRELAAKALTLREGFASLNAAVLSVSLLADAVSSGAPYVRPLAGVRAVAAADPDMADALAQLEPHAGTGIPTVPALAARFPAVADAIARAAPTTGGATWVDRVVDKFASLVTIRATGSAAARAGGIDAVLAEAETALAGGDLRAAVDLLTRIEGPAAAPAAPWIQDAQLRLAADRAVATLQEQAAARLAAARG